MLTAHAILSVPYAFGFSSKVFAVLCVPVAAMTSIYTAFLFKQARGRELWSEDRMLPAVLGAQAGAAAAALAWFYGESAMAWMIVYLAVMLVSCGITPPTRQAHVAHKVMMGHRTFRYGLLFAFAAVLWPPAVFLAFACFDWIYIKAGQEVALS